MDSDPELQQLHQLRADRVERRRGLRPRHHPLNPGTETCNEASGQLTPPTRYPAPNSPHECEQPSGRYVSFVLLAHHHGHLHRHRPTRLTTYRRRSAALREYPRHQAGIGLAGQSRNLDRTELWCVVVARGGALSQRPSAVRVAESAGGGHHSAGFGAGGYGCCRGLPSRAGRRGCPG